MEIPRNPCAHLERCGAFRERDANPKEDWHLSLERCRLLSSLT